MAPISQIKANYIRNKIIERKKKVVINSDKEARQNMFVELELNSTLEKFWGYEKISLMMRIKFMQDF